MSEALAGAAHVLAQALTAAQPLWQPAPFRGEPAWLVTQPALTAALLSLEDDQVAALEAEPETLVDFMAGFLPAVARVNAAAFSCLTPAPAPADLLPEKFGRDVPGRKWRQLAHFAQAMQLPVRHEPDHIIEWCSGKGHLGRLLARTTGLPVRSLERDAHLCNEGRTLAWREHTPQQFVCIDVLGDTGPARIDMHSHACALHACGDLHRQLIATVISQRAASLHLSPCCLHLTTARHWQPESRPLSGLLAISRENLRLAMQDTVTANASVIRDAQRLAAWRLGYDLLQRTLRGTDEYLPLPSLPARTLKEGFAAFCTRMASTHGVALPADTDYAHWEVAGLARQPRIRRLELLRHAFRRPLEILVACDRALLLAEAGYQVDVTTFCPRPLTPRNLMIRAYRRQASA